MHPAHPRARRTAAGLLVAAVLAASAGCGSGSSDDASSKDSSSGSASASPSSSPTKRSLATVTMAQADAALPSMKQVTGADTVLQRCHPTSTTSVCTRQKGVTYGTARYSLEGSKAKTDLKQGNGTQWQEQEADLEVYRYASDAIALQGLRRGSAAAAKAPTRVSTKAKRFSGGRYQLGVDGTARFSKVTVAGLQGYSVQRKQHFTSPAGKTSKPQITDIMLVRLGRHLLYASITMWPEKHADGDPEKLARELVEQYVDRLQQA